MSFVFNYIFKKIWGKPKTQEIVQETVPENIQEIVQETVPERTDEISQETVPENTQEIVQERTEETGILLTTDNAAILDDEAIVKPNIVGESSVNMNEELMNLFYNYNTDLDLIELLTKASEQSMMYTLKIIAHIFKTKCEANSFFYRKTCDWLFQNHEKQLILNIPFFLEKCGRWDDLSNLPSDSESFKQYIHVLSNNLKTDLDNINNNVKSISQMANWIQHDKNILSYVAKELGINVKTLKKDYLKPLTKNLSLEDVNVNNSSSMSEKSEKIVSFNLSHHEIMMSTLSDQCYDDVKCLEQSLGTNDTHSE